MAKISTPPSSIVSAIIRSIPSSIFGGSSNGPIVGQKTIHQAGQSLGEYPSILGDPIVALKYCEWQRSDLGLSSGAPFVQYNGARPWVTSDAGSKTGINFSVRYVNSAVNATNLVDASVPGNIATGTYWRNTQNNSATSPGGALDATPNTPGPLERTLLQNVTDYGIDLLLWSQGQADQTYVQTAAGRATYKAQLIALFNDVRTTSGNPNLPIGIQHIDRNQTGSELGCEIIAEIQTEIALELSNVYIIAEEYFSQFAVNTTVANCSLNGTTTVLTTNTTNLVVGREVQGVSGVPGADGIPANTFITAISPGVSFTMDKAATITASGQTLVFREGTHPHPGSVVGYNTDQTEGFYNIFRRLSPVTKRIFDGTARKEFGPKITAITPVYGGNTIDVTVTHDLGTDLTTRNGPISAASIPFFRVENNGAVKTLTNIVKINPTTLRITVSGTIADGTVYVWSAYGAMNKTDHRDIIIDNATIPMPLTRAMPNYNAGLRTYTDLGRTDLQTAGFSNVVAQWDATLSNSYTGFGNTIKNLIGTPVDGSSKAAYDMTINNMSFAGVAGLTTGRLVSGGTSCYMKVAANTTFLNNLHKTTAGQPAQAFTQVIIFSTPDVTTSAFPFSTSNQLTESGVSVNYASGNLAFRQRGDTANVSAGTGSIAINTTYLLIIGKSAGGTALSYWINTRTGTATTVTYNSGVADASSTYHLFARSDGGQGLPTNAVFKGAALFNTYIDNTVASALADYYNTLHATTYA